MIYVKVLELIKALKTIDDPETATILINDTAAGFREIKYIEDGFDNGHYVVYIKKPKGHKWIILFNKLKH